MDTQNLVIHAAVWGDSFEAKKRPAWRWSWGITGSSVNFISSKGPLQPGSLYGK